MAELVDSSVWIDYLRNLPSAATAHLTEVLTARPEDLLGCPPVRMELSVPSEEMTRRRTLAIYDQLDSVHVMDEDFDSAAEIFRDVRSSGHTVRSMVDCLIAALAERSSVRLVHADIDYIRIQAVRPNLATLSLLQD
ncbi:type II toxin-antitoxin system VapC family toxin [Microlunatus elymi]|nr:PIN domain-containing protein [Microlunatus elymi]